MDGGWMDESVEDGWMDVNAPSRLSLALAPPLSPLRTLTALVTDESLLSCSVLMMFSLSRWEYFWDQYYDHPERPR